MRTRLNLTPIGRPSAVTAALMLAAAPLAAQEDAHHHTAIAPARGWSTMWMAQVFPTLTTASPWRQHTLLSGGLYATQPAAMIDVSSRDARFVLRTTLNFEAWTQPDGELTFGGWGEGFIDSRHPHTLVHEAIASLNLWNAAGGTVSVSAGKGFAPYGTDDPMARPAVKFPTNHHLSQIPERWLAGASYLRNGWSLEAAVFGGGEPAGPYDFRNIETFGDSWSARLAKRLGAGAGAAAAPWELSASYAHVEEVHHESAVATALYNAAVRHQRDSATGALYWLSEASWSDPDAGAGHFSILTEAALRVGADGEHRPYARVEHSTRPEYARQGAPGTPGFFRYDHGAHETGATRWTITTIGYGRGAAGRTSIRPYVEAQFNQVAGERGSVDPVALFGGRRFWSLSAGARVFIGGGPMRMGSYGQFDPMAVTMRPAAAAQTTLGALAELAGARVK